ENWHNAQGLETWYFSFPAASLNDSSSYRVHSRAFDAAGNQQSASSTDIFIYDISLPATGVVYDGSDAGSDIDWTNENEAVNAYWTGFNDIVSGITQFEYKIIDGSANTLVPWTSVGQDTFVVDTSLSLLTGTQYFVSVRATDGAENISQEELSDGVVVDTIAPVIAYVYEGSSNNDLDYQYESDSVMVAWSGGDTRAIAYYAVALGSAPEQADIVDWVDVGTSTNHALLNLDLVSGQTYYGTVRAHDQAGNISGLMSGDGLTIDQDGPVPGQVSDYEIEDVDWIAINYQIEAFATGFTDTLSGVAEYYFSIGLAPNQDNVLGWTSTGSDSTILYPTDPLLTVGPTYYVNSYAIDAVDNIGATITSDGFGLDLDDPTPGTVSDGLDQDITWTNNDSSLSANWTGFSDATSGIGNYEYAIGSSAGGQNIVAWTNADSATEVTHEGLVLNHGTTYYFSVRGLDQVDHVSDPANSNGATVDTIPPVVTLIAEEVAEDPTFQGSDSSVTLVWEASDALSGVEHYEYALGTTAGDMDLVAWVHAGTDLTVTIPGLVLAEGETYFGSVRVFDLAGNVAEGQGDGVTVDITAPAAGTAMDITDLNNTADQSFTGSTTTLQASWSGFSDNMSGINTYEYAVGSTALQTDIKSWTSAGPEVSMTDDTFSLV
ncbi:MAG: hypothetical protein QGG54_13940, partial [Gammaproteobacteria bacterium]|nr:hypothetical protein [Gammaproteobacteria bacterium]